MIDIIYQSQLKKMRIKVISVREVKCNFCHEWILVKESHSQRLYTCSQCLTKYQRGALVHDENGQVHKITFTQDINTSLNTHKDASTQEDISLQSSQAFPWSQVKNILEDSSLTSEEKELIESRIELFNREYEHEAQSILDLMKELKKCKSQIFNEDNSQEETPRKSFQLASKKSVKELGSGHKKFSRLDEMAGNLQETRLKIPYQFHFGQQQIQQYKRQSEKLSDRSFGADLSNFSYDELFLNFKKISGIKSSRSNQSSEYNSYPSLRLNDEELKNRIDSYLETRYQSNSLQRILSSTIKEAYEQTKINLKTIQLVSFNIGSIDLMAYFSLFDAENLNTIKLINVGLRDSHLKLLLEWINNKKVESLVLTGNKLTDCCLTMFLRRSLPFLKEIYLGKNRISKQRMKENIMEIRSKFILYL